MTDKAQAKLDQAYRLGFAKAVAHLMYDCGVTTEQLESFKYWDKITLWAATGGKKTSMGFQVPPPMTKDESKQFHFLSQFRFLE